MKLQRRYSQEEKVLLATVEKAKEESGQYCRGNQAAGAVTQKPKQGSK